MHPPPKEVKAKTPCLSLRLRFRASGAKDENQGTPHTHQKHSTGVLSVCIWSASLESR
jgi:hypothetical protein